MLLSIIMLPALLESGLKALVSSSPPSLPAFYRANGAPEDIVSLVSLSNKRFGSVCEKLITNLVSGKPVPDSKGRSGWDMEFPIHGLEITPRFEIKSSRYWRSGKQAFFKWQHILADHEWSHLLLCAIDFDRLRMFALSKPQFMDLIRVGKITQQGGAGGQGCWFELKHIVDVATELTTELDYGHSQKSEYHIGLVDFVTANPASHEPVSQTDIAAALSSGQEARKKK